MNIKWFGFCFNSLNQRFQMSYSKSNSKHSQDINDPVAMYNTLLKMSENNLQLKISEKYLIFKDSFNTIKVRQFAHDKSRLLAIYNDNFSSKRFQFSTAKLVEFFTRESILNMDQWYLWKRFISSSQSSLTGSSSIPKFHIENESDLIETPNGLARLFKKEIESNGIDNEGSVDVVLNENDSKKIFFIFNNGYSDKTLAGFFNLGNVIKSTLLKCRKAGVEELVFWDGITSRSKRFRIEDMATMSYD